MMSALPSLAIVCDASAAAALVDPTRLGLLRELARPEGDSAAGLARRVGMKRQLVNYHLRELERVGLVELVEERRRGSVIERIVRASAASYAVDPRLMGALGADPAKLRECSSADYFVALAARMIGDVAALRERTATGKELPTHAVGAHIRFGSAADHSAFFEDLTNELAKLIAEYHDQEARDGQWASLTLGSCPMLTSDERETAQTDQSRAGIESA